MDSTKTILVADDDQSVRFVLEQALSRAGFRVRAFAEGRGLLADLKRGGGDLVITDIVMPDGSGLDLVKTVKSFRPGMPVIVITAQSTLRNAVHAFERGAFDYLPKPFDIQDLVSLVNRALADPEPPLRRDAAAEMERFGGFIGVSAAMQELFRTIGRLANSEMTVLIHGESGTGKELVARAVHAFSPRREGPFTAINMAAIPRNLIESELFGHEKGSFTGAIARRAGHFERAAGGSLFLDEIGDMPLEAQTRLLRVLQDGTFTRIGGTESRKSDVRIIAATHQDLPNAIARGLFREDLFYRLNVVPLLVPSLRERKEDVPILAEHFLHKSARELGVAVKRLSEGSLERLLQHDWPGNVRELENLIHRLTVLVPDEVIGVAHLDLPRLSVGVRRPGGAEGRTGEAGGVEEEAGAAESRGVSIGEAVQGELDRFFATLGGLPVTGLYQTIVTRVEEVLLARVLEETRGNRVKAAQMLGINRNTLRKKIQELGLDGGRSSR
ncbi:MAG: nitrogen regulation protein NR(I) [Magnetococcales bacterium]|nr:nitrogen regulation protein NR(I) [Magnetococcales bacterium]